MTKLVGNGNQGVIVTGGSFSANDIAVGENASIVKNSCDTENTESIQHELLTELTKLIKLMEESQVDKEKISAARTAKAELESATPNLFLVKSILGSTIDVIKTIGTVAGSALSIKTLLGVLVP